MLSALSAPLREINHPQTERKTSTNPIIADIKVGKLAANVINGRYLISRQEAERYIESNEYTPDEGTV